jgi:hypothetical protein
MASDDGDAAEVEEMSSHRQKRKRQQIRKGQNLPQLEMEPSPPPLCVGFLMASIWMMLQKK